MATIQYIGARYVPKFFEGSNGSEWESGIAYEPLTIVTYLGNSFTSKKPVPANIGAPNLNSEYWVLTGNYNEQIASLSRDINNLRLESEAGDASLDERLDIVEESVEEIAKKVTFRLATDIKANLIGLYDCFETQIGCLAKYGDTLWTIEGVSTISGVTKASNQGKIREWSFGTGALLSEIDINTGHANSCCYNPNTHCLYIAPTWDYSIQDRPSANYIYKINYPAYTLTKISTGNVNALALCYDYETNKQYLLGYDSILYLYDATSDTISEYINLSDIGLNNISGALLQDAVIKGGIMLWTTARNQMCQYDISANDKIITYYNIDTYDSTNTFDMSEIEGMNFDESGRLICAFLKATSPNVSKHSIDSYTYRNTTSFICEIPTNMKAPINKYYLPSNIINQTITIRNIYNNFKLQDGYSLNTLFQFAALINPPSRIRLGSDFDAQYHCNRFSSYEGVIFDLNGHSLSHWNGFGVSKNTLTIEGTGTINMMDNYDEVFYVGRGGLITAASANITINNVKDGNNSYINAGSDSQLIIDSAVVTGDATLYVYNMERERYAVYSGARKIIDPT